MIDHLLQLLWLVTYIDGVTYVHKANVERHCKLGSLHSYAENLKVNVRKDNVEPSRPGGSNTENLSQNQKIDQPFKKSSTDSYIRMFTLPCIL